MKGRPQYYNGSSDIDDVSIHAPVKGRLTMPPLPFIASSFNPRPREGATYAGRWDGSKYKVSIHAPVKGRRVL